MGSTLFSLSQLPSFLRGVRSCYSPGNPRCPFLARVPLGDQQLQQLPGGRELPERQGNPTPEARTSMTEQNIAQSRVSQTTCPSRSLLPDIQQGLNLERKGWALPGRVAPSPRTPPEGHSLLVAPSGTSASRQPRPCNIAACLSDLGRQLHPSSPGGLSAFLSCFSHEVISRPSCPDRRCGLGPESPTEEWSLPGQTCPSSGCEQTHPLLHNAART